MVVLNGNESITLNIADAETSNLNLRLYDDSRTLMDTSMGDTSQEFINVTQSGTYYIEVYAETGASNLTS